MTKETEIENRETGFYSQLNLSRTTINHYKVALDSKFIRTLLSERYGYNTVFAVSDLDLLWEFYTVLNLHPHNIANHRVYSAAVNRYIKYLNNGNKYGRRIDYRKRQNNPDSVND